MDLHHPTTPENDEKVPLIFEHHNISSNLFTKSTSKDTQLLTMTCHTLPQIPARKVYSPLAKACIIFSTFAILINVNYSAIILTPISSEFQAYFKVTQTVFFCYSQIFTLIGILTYIPLSTLFAQNLKLCIIITVLLGILATLIKWIGRNDIHLVIFGQVLLGFTTQYAFIATPTIGSLIFKNRGSQIFITMLNILPYGLNIFFCVFPAIFAGYFTGKSGAIIGDIHFVGFLVSLGALPIVFVGEDFRVDLGVKAGTDGFREIVRARQGDGGTGGVSHSIRKYIFFLMGKIIRLT
jgi:hypothetical protein